MKGYSFGELVKLAEAALPKTDNAVSATKLQTARTIGGVAFDGTGNISLPGVNIAGTQNTSGRAAVASTADKLTTARNINGVAFDGTKNIDISAGAVGTYTKAEIDAKDNLKLDKAGGALTGIVSSNSNMIFNFRRDTGLEVGLDWSEDFLRFRTSSTERAKGIRLSSYDTPVAELRRDGNIWARSGMLVGSNRVFHEGFLPNAGQVGTYTKSEIDSKDNLKLNLTGGTLTGALKGTTLEMSGTINSKVNLSVTSSDPTVTFSNGTESGYIGLRTSDGLYVRMPGADSTRRKVYHQGFKPTATDVGLSNYKNASSAAYGSVDISGGKGGYAGIHFSDYKRTLMVHGTISGIYKSDTSSWQWHFTNDTLSSGKIPWARIPDAPATATRWPTAAEVGALPASGSIKIATSGFTNYEVKDMNNASGGTSFLKKVILLMPRSVTNAGQNNRVVGTITASKSGGNILSVVDVNIQSVYNATYGNIVKRVSDRFSLITCNYEGISWVALLESYSANPFNNYTFVGQSAAFTKPEHQLKVIAYAEEAHDSVSARVINAEINDSIATLALSEDLFIGNGKRVYHTGKKPTAADVGALPLTGGTVTGTTTFNNAHQINLIDSSSYLNRSGANVYLAANASGGRVIIEGKDHPYARVNGTDYYIYHAGFKPTAADVGALASNGTAVAATKLATPRAINGVNFDGSANITITAAANGGTSAACSGNAATATKLQNPRTIAGVSFDGTANISISAGNVGTYTKAEIDSKDNTKLNLSGGTLTNHLAIKASSSSFQGLNIENTAAGWSYLRLKATTGTAHIAVNTNAIDGGTAGALHLRPAGQKNGSLIIQNNAVMRHQTATGYWEVGSQNASHCHYNTDRPNHWFNKEVKVNGEIYCGASYTQRVYHQGFKPTAADVGALPSGGTAAAATKLATPRAINGVNFDGSANITITAAANGGTSAACSGNAATATTLQTARTIGGVSFNGSANIVPTDINPATSTSTGMFNLAWFSGTRIYHTNSKMQVRPSDGYLTAGSISTGSGTITCGNLNASGVVSANSFRGDGASLTNLPIAGMYTGTDADLTNYPIGSYVFSTGWRADALPRNSTRTLYISITGVYNKTIISHNLLSADTSFRALSGTWRVRGRTAANGGNEFDWHSATLFQRVA